jgi:hypothetical protein
MNNPTPHPPPERGRSSPGLLIFAWLFVGLPLAWGVMQTFFKALALFR